MYILVVTVFFRAGIRAKKTAVRGTAYETVEFRIRRRSVDGRIIFPYLKKSLRDTGEMCGIHMDKRQSLITDYVTVIRDAGRRSFAILLVELIVQEDSVILDVRNQALYLTRKFEVIEIRNLNSLMILVEFMLVVIDVCIASRLEIKLELIKLIIFYDKILSHREWAGKSEILKERKSELRTIFRNRLNRSPFRAVPIKKNVVIKPELTTNRTGRYLVVYDLIDELKLLSIKSLPLIVAFIILFELAGIPVYPESSIDLGRAGI